MGNTLPLPPLQTHTSSLFLCLLWAPVHTSYTHPHPLPCVMFSLTPTLTLTFCLHSIFSVLKQPHPSIICAPMLCALWRAALCSSNITNEYLPFTKQNHFSVSVCVYEGGGGGGRGRESPGNTASFITQLTIFLQSHSG